MISKEEKAKVLNSITEDCRDRLLHGILPKNVLRYLIHLGFSEKSAKIITDKACLMANELSHYKIGGKYCKENNNQIY